MLGLYGVLQQGGRGECGRAYLRRVPKAPPKLTDEAKNLRATTQPCFSGVGSPPDSAEELVLLLAQACLKRHEQEHDNNNTK
jgi:hypothetical protein